MVQNSILGGVTNSEIAGRAVEASRGHSSTDIGNLFLADQSAIWDVPTNHIKAEVGVGTSDNCLLWNGVFEYRDIENGVLTGVELTCPHARLRDRQQFGEGFITVLRSATSFTMMFASLGGQGPYPPSTFS